MAAKAHTHNHLTENTPTTTPQPATDQSDVVAAPQSHVAPLSQRTRHDPHVLTPRDVLHLQRTVGNQVVCRLLAQTGSQQPIHTGEPNSAGLHVSAYPQGASVHAGPGQAKPLMQGMEHHGDVVEPGDLLQRNEHVLREGDNQSKATVQRKLSGTTKNSPRGRQPGILQRLPVRPIVSAEAVVRANQSKRWMINQDLRLVGYPGWHITIIPINQEKWGGRYKLPADGHRGITDWMEFAEFHITTSDGSKRFFYTDMCLPLRESMESRGKSPPWGDKDGWAYANWIVAQWFNKDYYWLQDYVSERPEAERAEQEEMSAEQQYNENMWTIYNNFIRAGVGRFSKEPYPAFDLWKQKLEAAYQGTPKELRQHVRQEAKQSAQIYVHKGPWKQDGSDEEDGGYEWETHWIKGGQL